VPIPRRASRIGPARTAFEVKARLGVLEKHCNVSFVLPQSEFDGIPMKTITGPADCGRGVQTVGRLSYPVDGMQHDPKASDSQVNESNEAQ